jgi:hypothetical protein
MIKLWNIASQKKGLNFAFWKVYNLQVCFKFCKSSITKVMVFEPNNHKATIMIICVKQTKHEACLSIQQDLNFLSTISMI